MNKYQDALKVMCERCMNHEMCMGTGCNPKLVLQEMIHNAARLEKALEMSVEELMIWVDDWEEIKSKYSKEQWIRKFMGNQNA